MKTRDKQHLHCAFDVSCFETKLLRTETPPSIRSNPHLERLLPTSNSNSNGASARTLCASDSQSQLAVPPPFIKHEHDQLDRHSKSASIMRCRRARPACASAAELTIGGMGGSSSSSSSASSSTSTQPSSEFSRKLCRYISATMSSLMRLGDDNGTNLRIRQRDFHTP